MSKDIVKVVNGAIKAAHKVGIEGYPMARGIDYIEDNLAWGTTEYQRAYALFIEWCDKNNVA